MTGWCVTKNFHRPPPEGQGAAAGMRNAMAKAFGRGCDAALQRSPWDLVADLERDMNSLGQVQPHGSSSSSTRRSHGTHSATLLPVIPVRCRLAHVADSDGAMDASSSKSST